jgi:hypothetical protein
MATKKYFKVRAGEAKTVQLDPGTYAIVRAFKKKRNLSFAEAINLLIGPAITAEEGLDFMKVLHDGGFLQGRTTAKVTGKSASHSEA